MFQLTCHPTVDTVKKLACKHCTQQWVSGWGTKDMNCGIYATVTPIACVPFGTFGRIVQLSKKHPFGIRKFDVATSNLIEIPVTTMKDLKLARACIRSYESQSSGTPRRFVRPMIGIDGTEPLFTKDCVRTFSIILPVYDTDETYHTNLDETIHDFVHDKMFSLLKPTKPRGKPRVLINKVVLNHEQVQSPRRDSNKPENVNLCAPDTPRVASVRRSKKSSTNHNFANFFGDAY